MSANISVTAALAGGGEVTFNECISFRLQKERYTPYSQISGVFLCRNLIGEVMHVTAQIDGKTVHFGTVDRFEMAENQKGRYVSFSSRGFSLGLSHNNIEPGMIYSPTLDSLMQSGTASPNVTWEQSLETIRYIFIKEGGSKWDGIVAYTRKLNGSYPYIAFPNKVRISWDNPQAVSISASELVGKAMGASLSSVVSKYYMKDVDGEYTLTYQSPFAAERSIVREKYINLDDQWLDDPEGGLKHKVDFTARGSRYTFLKYKGYKGEDLRDNISCETSLAANTFGTKEVSRLLVEYSKKGLFTSLWFYDDEYTATGGASGQEV